MVELASPSVVAILTRAPSSGGKSRLFAELRRPPDRALLEALLLDTLDAVSPSDAARIVAVEPAGACDSVAAIVPPDTQVVPQHGDDLGERMAAVMRTLFAAGARDVIVIGSDLPDLPPHTIADALRALQSDPASIVIGPANDGGYYLIAARHVPEVFARVEWGTPRVLMQTLEHAKAAGRRVHVLPALDDVDTAADLARVRAPRTRAWVDAHVPTA